MKNYKLYKTESGWQEYEGPPDNSDEERELEMERDAEMKNERAREILANLLRKEFDLQDDLPSSIDYKLELINIMDTLCFFEQARQMAEDIKTGKQ